MGNGPQKQLFSPAPDCRIRILGVPVDNLTMRETLDRIEGFIRAGKPHQHVVVNVNKLVQARRNPEMLRIIEGCDLINADGQPIVFASRLLGHPLSERIAGIDLMLALIRLAAEKGYRVFFLGARPEIVKSAVERMRCAYPALQVAGWRHGYWSAEEEASVVSQVQEAAADIVFVAISSPRKEQFLSKNLGRLGVSFAMGVGGSFDVLAGLTRRAPRWMQSAGLEWLWRLVQEPGRLWRRYLVDDIVFPWWVIREMVRIRRNPVSTKLSKHEEVNS
jgi:N-acetylglucosaminyldiphosphoundecaprenol N-acetyl-beta-D-mannosaminyltransferase